jgi:hypothetical protein
MLQTPVKDSIDETPDPIIHELSIMDGNGDTKIIWDPDKQDEVDNARRTFSGLVKKGYRAWSVDKEGEKRDRITMFDPKAAKLILAGPYVGG